MNDSCDHDESPCVDCKYFDTDHDTATGPCHHCVHGIYAECNFEEDD